MARENPPVVARFPWVSVSIVTVLVAVFLWEIRAPGWDVLEAVFEDYGFTWSHFVAHPWKEAPTLISSTLIHADRAHIISNLIFFLLFGPAVEMALGSAQFLVSYLIWGAMAALMNGYFSPFSSAIGASGAISGAAGAFFVLYPLRMPVSLYERLLPRVQFSLVSQLLRLLGSVPAVFYVGLWFMVELKYGFYSLMPHGEVRHGLIAHWAHVGGFAAGALTAYAYLTLKQEAKRSK